MKQIRRATIDDVARKAGVGTTTVSRVINGGKLVAPEVRERIEKIIHQLHYRPSQAARSMARARSHSIGLIVPRITDPFFASIASVAQGICRKNNHTLLISASLDLEEQVMAELKVFEQERVDGLIIVPPPNRTSIFRNYCKQLGHRVVSVDLPIEGCNISSVLTNNAEATAKATRHLIEHGRKRILFLGTDARLNTIAERKRGYSEAIAKAGLREMTVLNANSYEYVEQAIIDASSGTRPIDGLITANSAVGIYAFQAMQKHKISVPSKIALITWGNFPLADALQPSVTAISQPITELGRLATELLFSQLQAKKPRSRSLQVPSEIILRESCGCKGLDRSIQFET